MVYFNDNIHFGPTTSTGRGFDMYSFPSQALTTEDAEKQAYSAQDNQRGIDGERPGLWAKTSYKSEASATQGTTHAHSYPNPSFTGHRWPILQAHSQMANYPGWDAPFSSGTAMGVSAVPAPGNVPFGHWGGNQSGPPTHMFHQNVLVPYQFSTGPDRNKFIQTGRFQPYGMHRAGTAEHVNVDAQAASELTPSVGSQTPEPSGEIDELAADDEPSKRGRLPRGKGKPRKHRIKVKGDALKLFDWAQKQNIREDCPSFNQVLAAAIEVIKTVRPEVSDVPYLAKTATKDTEAPTGSAKKERERRLIERELYEGLSKLYPRGPRPWARSQLLSRLIEDLESHPALQNSSENPVT